MKLDQLLLFLATLPALVERGVTALEKIAGGAAPANVVSFQAPAEEPEEPKAKAAPKGKAKAAAAHAGPTPEELLGQMSELVTPAMEKDPSMGAKFRNVAIKHGAERFSEIPVANLPAALADVEALCEGSVNSATKLF